MNISEYVDLKLVVYLTGDINEFPVNILVDNSVAHENNVYVHGDVDCFFFLGNSVLYEHYHDGMVYRSPSLMIYVGDI